jgi:4-diphosphocytidyl-2-C-methyl-D-erythritol kinase
MRKASFRSFAKINLGLEVVGRLPSGYHELKTLFATISLHDIIDIAIRKSGVTVACDHPSVPGDETNLAHRAAVAMLRLSGRSEGVAIRIRKRIPVGGGLGGGSSNAATVLRALDLMWNLGLGADGLQDAARALGADVPYFLVGGPALGLGRGDLIHPLDFQLREKVLIVSGGGGVSTASVFSRFASLGGSSGRASRIDSFLRAASSKGTPSLASLRNDLEPAAAMENPELAGIARKLRRVGRSSGALQTAMSGSGSSFFLLFGDTAHSREAASALRGLGLKGRPCTFVSRAAFARRFEIRG